MSTRTQRLILKKYFLEPKLRSYRKQVKMNRLQILLLILSLSLNFLAFFAAERKYTKHRMPANQWQMLIRETKTGRSNSIQCAGSCIPPDCELFLQKDSDCYLGKLSNVLTHVQGFSEDEDIYIQQGRIYRVQEQKFGFPTSFQFCLV